MRDCSVVISFIVDQCVFLPDNLSLNNLFWNLNSFDAAASFASETADMKTMYPRGIFIGLGMCILFYLVPLMIAVGATDYSQSDWVDGHLGAVSYSSQLCRLNLRMVQVHYSLNRHDIQVAVDIGGKWLGGWTIFAAGISNLALFEAELSADAFQLMVCIISSGLLLL